MNFYGAVLFVHVAAALLLTAALTLEAVMLYRWQGNGKSGGVRVGLAVASLALLFFSGGYLTDRVSSWKLAWPKVALAMLVLIAILGGISRNRMRVKRLPDRILTLSLNLRMALVLGAVFLMSATPGLQGSLIVFGAAVALGLLVRYTGMPQSDEVSAYEINARVPGPGRPSSD